MTANARRRAVCLILMLLATIAGLIWRMAPLHLPWFWFKYGGSALWAIAVYWLVAAILPRSQAAILGLLAAAVALAVEFSRLIPSPALEAFRITLAGRLILGRFFSPRNIAAYWLAILAAATLDSLTRPGRRNS
jgi:hypothetical protein